MSPSIGRRIDWLNTNIAHSTLTEQIALASLFFVVPPLVELALAVIYTVLVGTFFLFHRNSL